MLASFREDKDNSRLRERASASYMKIRARSSFVALVSLVECCLTSTSFELWEDKFFFVQLSEAHSLVSETRWLAVQVTLWSLCGGPNDFFVCVWMSSNLNRTVWHSHHSKNSTSVLTSRHWKLLTHHVTCWNSNFSNSLYPLDYRWKPIRLMSDSCCIRRQFDSSLLILTLTTKFSS